MTVVAIVPTNPFDFNGRRFLRKFLSKPARRLFHRHEYHEIKTLPVRKIQPHFDWYLARNPKLAKRFEGIKHINYTTYKWNPLDIHTSSI